LIRYILAEKMAFEIGHFCTFQTSVTLTIIIIIIIIVKFVKRHTRSYRGANDLGSDYTAYQHVSLIDLYGETIYGQTDRYTNIWTGGQWTLRPVLLGRFLEQST